MKIIIILLSLIIFIIALSNIYIYYGILPKKGQMGNRGPKGDIGPNGEIGDMGDRGSSGFRGPRGLTGKNVGVKGVKGDRGIDGEKGDEGEKGMKGVKGKKGLSGPMGVKGELGNKGKKGLEGPVGPNRIIPHSGVKDCEKEPLNPLDPIPLIANRNKCVLINAKDQVNLKCPKNMAIFEMIAKKVGRTTSNSNIDSIVCCEMAMEKIYSPYFSRINFKTQMLLLSVKLDNDFKKVDDPLIPGSPAYPFILEYIKTDNDGNIDRTEFDTLKSNFMKVKQLIDNGNNRSVREIPIEILRMSLTEDKAQNEKFYTDEELITIKENWGTVTAYEYYILNLLFGLIQRDPLVGEDKTDYKRIVEEIYVFPRNNIDKLVADLNNLE